MKPDWDSLGAEYADSSSVLIGDVDCTVHQDLCSEYGVSGYPTIKYFTSESDPKGDSYQGGRGLDALRTFVQDKLEVKCSVSDQEGCSEKELKFIKAYQEKSADDVQAQLTRLDGMKGKKMKPELLSWVNARLRLLKEMSADGGKAEL